MVIKIFMKYLGTNNCDFKLLNIKLRDFGGVWFTSPPHVPKEIFVYKLRLKKRCVWVYFCPNDK